MSPEPTAEPTENPTTLPTSEPTEVPTVEITPDPSPDPTEVPTVGPTADPTEVPTVIPTADPTEVPTVIPTADPTEAPTVAPTADPTSVITMNPTIEPTPSQYVLSFQTTGCGSTNPSGSVSVDPGIAYTISATPCTGYKFISWSVYSGSDVSFENDASAITTVTLANGNATIRANFEILTYTLTIQATAGGTFTPASPVTVNHGVAQYITATPTTGYRFINWTVTGGSATFSDANLANTGVTLTSGNAVIQANFALKTFTLTVVSDGNGNISPAGSLTVEYGVGTPITATPSANYHFVRWNANPGSATYGNQLAANTTVTLTIGNATVHAIFELDQYVLTIQASTGGTFYPTSPRTVTYGVATSISATAATGYDFVNWTVESGTATLGDPNVSSTTVTLTNGDATIRANFTLETYTLTIQASTGGSFTPTTPQTVSYNVPININAIPSAGYHFVNWSRSFGSASFGDVNAASTTVAATGNATIRANFAVNQYILTIETGGGGTFTPASPKTVNHGVATSVTATPDSGHNFVNWTATSGNATIANATSSSTTVTLTDGDATIRANFVLKSYVLTITATTGGTFTPTSPQTVVHGASTNVIAAAITGYHFNGWTVYSGSASFIDASAANTSVVLSSGNATIRANFVINMYILTCVSGGNGSVTPAAPQAVNHGASTAIGATPSSGYRFSGWSITSGSASLGNPYASSTTVVLTDGDATVQADFIIDYGSIWTERSVPGSMGSNNWKTIASSSDGTRLAAIVHDDLSRYTGSYLYTSTDSGATWTEQTGAPYRPWVCIASSADGLKLAAVFEYDYVNTSTDGGITWTARTTSGFRNWYSIASSSDGTKLAAVVYSGLVYTSADSGATWMQRDTAGNRKWYNIASSSDGTRLAAVIENGYIYTSPDGGGTWNERISSGSRNWRAVASSADGLKLAATVNGGYIYTSVDGGATWVERTGAGNYVQGDAIASSQDGSMLAIANSAGRILTSTNSGATWVAQPGSEYDYWSAIAVSADGSKIAAGIDFGFIYTSQDTGVAWTKREGAGRRDFTGIASSSNGSKLAACVNRGYIYTSTDSGVSWTERRSAGCRTWYGISSSADGTKIAAIENSGYIYTSADSGSTWTQRRCAYSYFMGIASSADGIKLTICTPSTIYTSTDSGATWTERFYLEDGYWQSIASSADGTKIVAVSYGDYIYTSADSGATWTPQTNSGERQWMAVASSADGTRLVAALGNVKGAIYTSIDSGVTWVERTSSGSRDWTSVCCSADGTVLASTAADTFAGYIYTSSDGGATWMQRSSMGDRDWASITCSSDGTKYAACGLGEFNLFTSP